MILAINIKTQEMKNSLKTWLVATISTSIGIALGILLSSSAKCRNCEQHENEQKLRKGL